MYIYRSMDVLKIVSGLLFIAGIFTLCCAIDENGSLDIQVSCNHTGIVSSILLDVPFEGVVYARGNFYNPSCRYDVVQSLTRIQLYLPANDCGTVIQEVGGDIYISNVIVVQKYSFAETVWDIVQNVSCKIPPQVSSVDDFSVNGRRAYYHADGLEAWMEVRSGADVFSGQEVHKLGVGDEISVAVHLKDDGQNKDMRVLKCWASDGETLEKSKYVIELYDFYKCEESEWMSNFTLTTGVPNISDTLTYATLKAFKFPSTGNLHFTCAIEICSNDCFRYCKLGESEKKNLEVSREFQKRSIPSTRKEPLPAEIPLPVRLSVIPLEMTTLSPSKQAYLNRINYMKATIKAMGSKLKKVRESKAENDSSFQRRISGTTLPTKSGRVVKRPSIKQKVKDNVSSSENVTEVFVQPWNVVYFFNLSHTVTVHSTRELTFRREMFSLSNILKNCVGKLKFILITAMLVFLVFCLALVCMSLAISLRREKKKHKIDNFLLYNYF